MITIIAGSRTITDKSILQDAIKASKFNITAVIYGECKKGVDRLGKEYADANGLPIYGMPALWEEYGRSVAGSKRNEAMAIVAKHYNGGLIAVWNGKSSGTASMIKYAKKHKLKLFIYKVEG